MCHRKSKEEIGSSLEIFQRFYSRIKKPILIKLIPCHRKCIFNLFRKTNKTNKNKVRYRINIEN